MATPTSFPTGDAFAYAVGLLLEYADRTLPTVPLVKGLFYLDLTWLRDHGTTFTGVDYVALDHGPVPDNYKTLLKKMEDDGLIQLAEVPLAPGIVAKPVTLLVSPPPPEPELARVARDLAEWVGRGRRSVDLSEIAHKNVAWQQAFHRGGNGTPINMIAALDQILEPDPWLDDPATPRERAAVSGDVEEF